MSEFRCADCLALIPITDGRAMDSNGLEVCYPCCGARDHKAMIETGKATLYLSFDDWGPYKPNMSRFIGFRYVPAKITNWPGTLAFNTGAVKYGRHNMARNRYDVWFMGPDGREWHGVTYGDNTQICHCKRGRS